MNITEYFIKHPIIAFVLNCMIVIIGWACLHTVSIREYPEVKIPIFSVYTNYPNASADQVELSVTDPLEDQLAGIEGLDYMTSKTRPGSSSIDLIFKEGTSIDNTLNSIREAVDHARLSFPNKVTAPQVERRRESSNGLPFIAISLSAKDQEKGALVHYADSSLKNSFRSLKGVSSVQIWGSRYTMMVKLDPKKMYALGINVKDVYDALEKATTSWPVGRYRETIPTLIELNLSEPEDFSKLVIKEKDEENKKPIYLDAIATIELNTNDKEYRARINGTPTLILAISKANDANPLEVSKTVHHQVNQLQKSLPEDYEISIVLDQSEFIKTSLKNIQFSLIEAGFFVALIIFLFLGNLRATLIPLVTIPISLIGGMIFIKLCGYSLNIITLLAMVLGTGLVVDDAIVVLENISRHIEKGMSSLEATIKGSHEIGFAIIAMTLTLGSVYLPLALIEGTIGQLFREFAVMLAGSVIISGIVALTLSPMMSKAILKKTISTKFSQKLLLFFTKIENFYFRCLEKSFFYKKYIFLIVLLSAIGTLLLLYITPRETAPPEDRGLMGAFIPPPAGKNLDDIEKIAIDVEKELMTLPEGQSCLTFMGEWGASVMLPLKPYNTRHRSARDIVRAITPKMSAFPSTDIWPWSSDSGLPGTEDGLNSFELVLAISTLNDYRTLLNTVEKVRKLIDQQHTFADISHNLRLDAQGYKIILDTLLLSRVGISPIDVAKTIEVFFSGNKSLNFQKDGLFYPITIKGENIPWTLDEIYIVNEKDKKISLGSVATLAPISSPKELLHFNQMRSAFLTVSLEKGQSFSSSMATFWKVTKDNLPTGFKLDWSGSTREYINSSTTMYMLLGLSLIFIFGILAVQFETFIDPLIIMITVPLGCFGALFTVYIFNQTINIYTQIGLITLIGLITKHGILIVEFPNQLKKDHISLEASIQQAAKLRLRPILMTTAAMILGAVPLILTNGAGKEVRYAIGIVIIGGLLFGTFFTLFILPQVYYQIKRFRYKFTA